MNDEKTLNAERGEDSLELMIGARICTVLQKIGRFTWGAVYIGLGIILISGLTKSLLAMTCGLSVTAAGMGGSMVLSAILLRIGILANWPTPLPKVQRLTPNNRIVMNPQPMRELNEVTSGRWGTFVMGKGMAEPFLNQPKHACGVQKDPKDGLWYWLIDS